MTDASPFSLRGKIVIQFGGSGLLGPALTTALVRADATVVIASRSPGSLLGELPAHAVFQEQVNIEDPASLQSLRDRVLARHKRIDGVVYNAASRPMRSFDDSLEAWQSSMATNATGFFSTMRIFGDALAAQKAGSIVNIASMQGMVGMNPWLYEGTTITATPDYFFHKAGMINLTRYLASYYGAQGVRVNTVSPGGITNPAKIHPAPLLERYAKSTMLGRMADAAEIGGAVVFLLSQAASYVTGTDLLVDGGYTSK